MQENEFEEHKLNSGSQPFPSEEDFKETLRRLDGIQKIAEKEIGGSSSPFTRNQTSSRRGYC